MVTDERVASVLRPFVRATAPVLRALRESDPLRLRNWSRGGAAEPGTSLEPRQPAREGVLGVWDTIMRQLDSVLVPGSSAWNAMTVQQRCDWWVNRVGRFFALMTGLPRFGGAITSQLPIRNALGLTAQGLVLSAIAAEHGITSNTVRVQLIAKVLLKRNLSEAVASGRSAGTLDEEDAKAAELTQDIDASRQEHGIPTFRAVGTAVWRMARALWEIQSELDKRPQGNLFHEFIGLLPVVGIVGGYLGERSALRRISREGSKWIRRHQRGAG